MGEAENQATSVLLPASGVAVYSNDKKTLDVAQSLSEDWRFARVDMQVHEGDIETATQRYKTEGSPDLVIVQTENVDDSFTGLLDDLASQCDEGTAAIVVGPKNDVYLYREMIEMGVSDYLVKPLKAEILAEVIAKTLIERIGVTGSKLVAMVGAKGGVGTSAVTQAMAWCASEKLDQKTIVLDCAGGWSALGVGMGYEPTTTLSEAARAADNDDEDSLERMLFEASGKLSVLATGSDAMLCNTVDAEQLETLLDMVMAKYPVVFVDLSGADAALKNAVLARATQVVLVSTPSLPALRLSRSLLQEISDIRGGNDDCVDLLVNMAGMDTKQQLTLKDVEASMERALVGEIPYDAKVFMGCESEGRKIMDDKAGEVLMDASILPIVQKILSLEGDGGKASASGQEAGLLGGLLKTLKK